MIATRPINQAAANAADDDFYAAHPDYVRDGQRVPLSATDPQEASLRHEWMESYQRHGGAVEEGGGTTPDNPTQPCCGPPPPPPPPNDEIRLVEIVEVITPASGSDVDQACAPRRQYINMLAENAHPEFGRSIRFRARVEWVSAQTRSLAGKTVHWYFSAPATNRQNLIATLQAGFTAAGTASISSTTDADGWTTVVAFIPSQYGGDNFEPFATLDAGLTGGISAQTYTVWRRLFYELDCMNRPSAGSYSDRADTAAMTTHMNDAFLDPVSTGTDASPAHVRMITESAISAWATGVRDGTGAPRYFHLILIDTIAWDPAPISLTFTCGRGRTISLPAETYLLDQNSWFVSATYRQGRANGVMRQNRFALTETGAPSTGDDAFVLTPDFSGLPVDPSRDIRVNLRITNWQEGSGLQIPNGPATIIGIRWRERAYRASPTDIDKSSLHTMMHEPGHAMGLAPSTLPDGTANAHHYLQSGSHCNALANTCIMFARNSPTVDFCPDCMDGWKGRDLNALPVRGTTAF